MTRDSKLSTENSQQLTANYQLSTVVVTGGAGFIGSHLSEELARQGYHVIILDDLSTGKKENITALINLSSHSDSSRDSSPITHHPSRPPTNSTNSITPQTGGVEFVQGSVTDPPVLQKLFHAVDYVFHLAAIPSVPRSIENPLATHEANITGTLNVLLAARDNSVKKVIYASSSSVYGDTPTLPKREDMLPHPQSPYAVTKLAGEYYCQVFHQVYALPTICLRYFNVYGPGQDPNSQYAAVIPRFISRVSHGEPPIIFGDGEQTRDFTFVRDAVEANILAARGDATGVFNVGTGTRVSINKLAKLVINLIGRSTEPIHQQPRPGDVRHSLADISKTRELGYNPRYSLKQGLKETISSLQSIVK